jgi:2-succinyl-5-enolpyruvyl-6-hydroxy-3-cyclohexene-1-carboxylate synthase
LAFQLADLLPPGLPVMLSASSPVRDWLTWSGRSGSDRRCFSFRGASGIDGTLSLAMGLALETGPML